MSEETVAVGAKVPPSTRDRIEAAAVAMTARDKTPCSLSDAVRELLNLGLTEFERAKRGRVDTKKLGKRSATK